MSCSLLIIDRNQEDSSALRELIQSVAPQVALICAASAREAMEVVNATLEMEANQVRLLIIGDLDDGIEGKDVEQCARTMGVQEVWDCSEELNGGLLSEFLSVRRLLIERVFVSDHTQGNGAPQPSPEQSSEFPSAEFSVQDFEEIKQAHGIVGVKVSTFIRELTRAKCLTYENLLTLYERVVELFQDPKKGKKKRSVISVKDRYHVLYGSESFQCPKGLKKNHLHLMKAILQQRFPEQSLSELG